VQRPVLGSSIVQACPPDVVVRSKHMLDGETWVSWHLKADNSITLGCAICAGLCDDDKQEIRQSEHRQTRNACIFSHVFNIVYLDLAKGYQGCGQASHDNEGYDIKFSHTNTTILMLNPICNQNICTTL